MRRAFPFLSRARARISQAMVAASLSDSQPEYVELPRPMRLRTARWSLNGFFQHVTVLWAASSCSSPPLRERCWRPVPC